LRNGRGGEIRTHFGAFQQTIGNIEHPLESILSSILSLLHKMQQDASKAQKDDRKR
jgi:hypothetical protein